MYHQPNYKYKSFKKFPSVNNYQTSSHPNQQIFDPTKQRNLNFSYQKPTLSNNAPTSQSNLLKQSIESSNKLDELLNKCKQIGSSSHIKYPNTIQAQNKVMSKANFLTPLNKYKLVKSQSSPQKIPILNKSLTITKNSKSKFKLVNQKCTKQSLNSFLNSNLFNSSKNRFKFIAKKSYLPQLKPLIKTSRNKGLFKIDNCKKRPKTSKKIISRFSLINGSTGRSLIKNKFKLVNSKQLKQEVHMNKIASNLIQRSKMTINRTLLKSQNNLNEKKNLSLNNKKKYCLFYNRFGRCSRGKNCEYIHDPKRVSLCPRFLRGTCKVDNCPFSHDTSPEKMPLCSFFASGCCNRENCPYQHVFYGKDAKFCVDFAKGYCPLGTKCESIHLLECPDFEKHKKCPRGKKCPLLHRKKKKENKISDNCVMKIEDKKSDVLAFFPDFKPKENNNIQISTANKIEIENNKLDMFKLRPSFDKRNVK
ncbi:unnamed protein product, partial [Brachionus calyciflorus]